MILNSYLPSSTSPEKLIKIQEVLKSELNLDAIFLKDLDDQNRFRGIIMVEDNIPNDAILALGCVIGAHIAH